VDLFERDVIVDALKRANGIVSSAARDLGTTQRILRYKITGLGIDWQRYRRRAGGRSQEPAGGQE
jgi:Nif-specific regulatory protein